MRLVGLVVLGCAAACGRLEFDPLDDAGSSGSMDGPTTVCPAGCAVLAPRYCYCGAGLVFNAAESSCETVGATLVVITNDGEDILVNSVYTSPPQQPAPTTAVWIGASDLAVEGEWRWPDGTQFWQGLDATMGGAPVNGGFNRWAVGAPNNSGPGENCATILANKTWNDADCPMAFPYVCEH